MLETSWGIWIKVERRKKILAKLWLYELGKNYEHKWKRKWKCLFVGGEWSGLVEKDRNCKRRFCFCIAAAARGGGTSNNPTWWLHSAPSRKVTKIERDWARYARDMDESVFSISSPTPPKRKSVLGVNTSLQKGKCIYFMSQEKGVGLGRDKTVKSETNIQLQSNFTCARITVGSVRYCILAQVRLVVLNTVFSKGY